MLDVVKMVHPAFLTLSNFSAVHLLARITSMSDDAVGQEKSYIIAPSKGVNILL